jgi:uncharacterized protein YceH (UPF0502 family)
MLRGPQTLGELKQRSEKLHRFESLAAVEETLDRLTSRELGRWLERRPGQKEARYTQLLETDQEQGPEPVLPPSPAPADEGDDLATEVARLRRELEALRKDVAQLRAELGSVDA